MIHISYPVLFIICFGCLAFGACIGMAIMAMCRISGKCSRDEEKRESCINMPPTTPRPGRPEPQG